MVSNWRFCLKWPLCEFFFPPHQGLTSIMQGNGLFVKILQFAIRTHLFNWTPHLFFFCVHHLYSLVVIAIVLACGTLSSSKTVLVVFAWLCDCCQGYIEPHFASIFSCKVWDKTFQDISKLLFDNTLMERKCIISMDLTNYFVYGKPSNIFLYNSPFEGGGGSKIDMVRSRGIFKNEYFETPCDCMLCLSTSALLSHLNSLNYKLRCICPVFNKSLRWRRFITSHVEDINKNC